MPARGSVNCSRTLTGGTRSVKARRLTNAPRRAIIPGERSRTRDCSEDLGGRPGPRSFLWGSHSDEVRMEVTVSEGDRLDYVLKRFRRQITKAGLFQDMKRKRFYESPGALRRRKDKAAARRTVTAARRPERREAVNAIARSDRTRRPPGAPVALAQHDAHRPGVEVHVPGRDPRPEELFAVAQRDGLGLGVEELDEPHPRLEVGRPVARRGHAQPHLVLEAAARESLRH